jgi:hypothetical protein
MTAAELMTPDVETIDASAPIAEAADRLDRAISGGSSSLRTARPWA